MLLWLMLLERLLDSDTLELGFALSLLSLDLFVVREMLDIFWVSVRLVGLCLGGGVEFLWKRV